MIPGLGHEFWQRPKVRGALARRDIPALYRALCSVGATQREIAGRVGQRQPDVSAIASGRPVLQYDVLVRIADGLGVHRGWMGLAYDDQSSEMLNQGNDAKEDLDMRRRAAIGNLLALASAGVVGSPVLGHASQVEHLMMAAPPPATVGGSDIAALRAWTAALRTLGRAGHPDIVNTINDAIRRAEAMRPAAAAGGVTAELSAVLSDLYLLCGWYHHDAWLTDPARWYYNRALVLAGDDALQRTVIMSFAGTTERDVGQLRDALKFHELGLMSLDGQPDHELWRTWMHLGSAGILAKMGGHDDAVRRCLDRANAAPAPVDSFHRADMAHARAGSLFALGQLDRAETYAAESVATFSADYRRDSIKARLRRATIHVAAGEADAPELTHQALVAAADIPSVRARRVLLPPLERSLRDRGGPTLTSLADRAAELRRGQRSVPSNQRTAATAC